MMMSDSQVLIQIQYWTTKYFYFVHHPTWAGMAPPLLAPNETIFIENFESPLIILNGSC